MFTTELIKNAWKIRREAAVKFNCRIMEISWKECLAMAKENSNPEMNDGLKFFIESIEGSIAHYQSKPKKSDRIMATRAKQIELYKKMIEVAKTNDMPTNNDLKVAYMLIEQKVLKIING